MGRKVAQPPHDVVGGFRVEACDRLVREQHLRALRERASNRDALRLPAGQSAGALSSQRDDANRVQMVVRGAPFDRR